MTSEEAVKLWKERIHDKADEVDPDNRRDWEDLAVGFFICLGFSVDESEDLYQQCIDKGCF
jgi:hypothetical protein